MKKVAAELFWLVLKFTLLLSAFGLAARLFAIHVLGSSPLTVESIRETFLTMIRLGAFFFAVIYGVALLLLLLSHRRAR